MKNIYSIKINSKINSKIYINKFTCKITNTFPKLILALVLFSFYTLNAQIDKSIKNNNKNEDVKLSDKTLQENIIKQDRFNKLYESAHPTPDYEAMVKYNNSILRKYKKNPIQTLNTAKIPIIQSNKLEPKFLVVNTIDEQGNTTQPMQNESSIAVNPTNPNNLIASSVDYRDNSSTWVYVSDDGGKSWRNINLGKPYPTWRSTNDPSVMFYSDGTGYLMYGAFPSNASGENGVFISRTTDEGKTWTKHIPVIEHKGTMTLDSAFEDKYYVQVDRAKNSTYSGHVYTPWKRVIALDSATQIVVTKSTNKGDTWSTPIPVSERLAGSSEDTTFGQSFPLITTGPKGQVYLVWNHGPKKGIGFSKSLDGGLTWTEQRIIHNYKEFGTPKFLSGQGVRHTVKGAVRAEAYPIITCNYTEGSRSGELYLCWSADSIPNVYFSKSTDEGETWSSPKIVTNTTKNDQFWPWIAVDPITEDLAIMYLDSRNDPENILVECFVSYSSDGGETWIDRLADDAQSDLRNNPFTGSSFAGDYSGLDFYNGIIYPSYVDMRNALKPGDPDSDVFTAVVNTKAPSPIENLEVVNMFDNLDAVNLKWDNVFETTFGKSYPSTEAKILVKRNGEFLNLFENLDENTSEKFDFNDNNKITPFEKYDYEISIIRNQDTSLVKKITTFPGGSKDIPSASLNKVSFADNYEEVIYLDYQIPSKKLDGITDLNAPTSLSIYINNDTTPIKTIPLTINDTNKVIRVALDFLPEDGFYNVKNRIMSKHPNLPEKTTVYSDYSESRFLYIGKPHNFEIYNFDDNDPPTYISGKWETTSEFAYTPPNSLTNSKVGNYDNNQNDTLYLTPYFDYYDVENYVLFSFNHAAIVENGDNCNVEYSLDYGKTWKLLKNYNKRTYPEWEDGELNASDWKSESFNIDLLPIKNEEVKVVYFRYIFKSNVFSVNDGWYIDFIQYVIDLSVEKDEKSFANKVYPNPANELITIKNTSNNFNNDFKIFNIFGIDITGITTYEIQGESTLINLTNLPAGVYYLKASDGQISKFTKIKN